MTKYQEIISWLEQSGYSPSGLMTMTIENLAHTIESYNHHKVNELNKSDVIKSVCDRCGQPKEPDIFLCNDCLRKDSI